MGKWNNIEFVRRYQREYARKWRKTPAGQKSKISRREYDRIRSKKPERIAYINKMRKSLIEKGYYKNRSLEYLKTWIGVIPEQTNCECCGRPIFFIIDNSNDLIHFDHRKNGIEIIKTNPRGWLIRHKAILKNLEIWKSCDFGMLCKRCNSILPTMGRSEWLSKVIAYIKKDSLWA